VYELAPYLAAMLAGALVGGVATVTWASHRRRRSWVLDGTLIRERHRLNSGAETEHFQVSAEVRPAPDGEPPVP
jgi:hypothetical protein